MADACVNLAINQVSTFKPRMIFRYANDFFCVFYGEDEFEQFFVKINFVYVNIHLKKSRTTLSNTIFRYINNKICRQI